MFVPNVLNLDHKHRPMTFAQELLQGIKGDLDLRSSDSVRPNLRPQTNGYSILERVNCQISCQSNIKPHRSCGLTPLDYSQFEDSRFQTSKPISESFNLRPQKKNETVCYIRCFFFVVDEKLKPEARVIFVTQSRHDHLPEMLFKN